MSSKDIAIKVENISKCYRIGLKEEVHENLAGAIFDFIKSPLKNYRKYRSLYNFDEVNPSHDYDPKDIPSDIIWALRNISFEVKRGEALGIIGKNGSGKSTLLKILSKITNPTSGHAEVYGRVSSLLEVGTGFHPELTGRENIFLNGSVLGMSKDEIDDKFDEIVDFSGVEKFIDTPVKRYSSGMKVRLAFSVAAHLEPEILFVDEVLAVGDADFQKKCLGKMGNAARLGRTVLLVSHNMAAVEQLCSKVIWIDDGSIVSSGPARDIITKYLNSTGPSRNIGPNGDLSAFVREPELQPVIVRGSINQEPFKEHHFVRPLAPLTIELDLHLFQALKRCSLGIHFKSPSGECIYAANTRWTFGKIDFNKKDLYRVECKFDKLPLTPDIYYLTLGFSSQGHQIDMLEKVVCIEVSREDVYGTGELPYKGQGFFLSQAQWKLDEGIKKVES